MEMKSLDLLPREELHFPCPICGGGEGIRLGTISLARLSQDDFCSEYGIISCSACGMVLSNTPESQEQIDEYYRNGGYSAAYLATPATRAQASYFHTWEESLFRHGFGPHSAIADFGCGEALLLRWLLRRGFSRAVGVDLSRSLCTLLREQGVPLFAGSITGNELPSGHLDVALLIHTMEHLRDVSGTLAVLVERLGKNGKLFVEIPDTAALPASSGGMPLRYLFPGHLLHCDAHLLSNLMGVYGFTQHESGTRIREEKGMRIHSLYGIYGTGDLRPWQADFTLAWEVASWFHKRRLYPSDALEALARSGRRVYIWGVGMHTRLMLGMSALAECRIVAVLDINPALAGSYLSGYRVESPERLREARPEDAVFIGALIHRERMEEILRKEYHFTGKVLSV